jgi:hypothetical protein
VFAAPLDTGNNTAAGLQPANFVIATIKSVELAVLAEVVTVYAPAATQTSTATEIKVLDFIPDHGKKPPLGIATEVAKKIIIATAECSTCFIIATEEVAKKHMTELSNFGR